MLISVCLENNTAYNEQGQPFNHGELGIIDSDELEYKTYSWDNENETGTAHEYWDGDQLRHRSVDLHLKKSLDTLMAQGEFGG